MKDRVKAVWATLILKWIKERSLYRTRDHHVSHKNHGESDRASKFGHVMMHPKEPTTTRDEHVQSQKQLHDLKGIPN